MVENKRSLKNFVRNYLFLLVIAGLIIAFDQWTKSLVHANLEFQEVWSPWPWLAPYVRIVHWRNTGAAFGIFQGFGDVFTVLAIVVAIAIVYYFPQVPREDWPLRLAMGLQLGGAVGNLIDRVTIGWVTDFVSVGRFPVFNVADASISIGVAVLIVGVWWKDHHQEPSEPAAEPDRSPEPVSDPLTEETWGE
jgi:signal peptidase II